MYVPAFDSILYCRVATPKLLVVAVPTELPFTRNVTVLPVNGTLLLSVKLAVKSTSLPFEPLTSFFSK